ncbi:MAG: M1 family aminopeptidase [Planctomycetota bacterium]|jgi:aminopeptidase N
MTTRTAKMIAAAWLATALLPLCPFALAEETDALDQHYHAKSPFASNYAPAANGRNYAPDRLVQVNHLTVRLTPDFDAKTIDATAILRFTPIAKPLAQLRLDATDLDIQSVTASAPVADHHTTEDALFITFAKPLPPGAEADVTIAYHAQPEAGLYFRTPDMGYHADDTHLWTQGESHLHRHWFPSYDYPNQKFTTEIAATVPADMTVIANGSITSDKTHDNNLKTVTWRQNQPHVNYLVALVIGYFDEISDNSHRVPMSFYTPVSQSAHAQNSFKTTVDNMVYFEKELGVPYPWDRYNQAVVDDFIAGGMENTTLTILTNGTLNPPEHQDLRTSQSLVAHELAHQWFGDYLTCKDWSQLWLNEGFATYYAHLYDQHRNGEDSMNYGLLRNLRSLTRANDKRPIVFKDYQDPGDQFDSRAYAKGGWVLHMLRKRLGDGLYRESITRYLKDNAFGVVVTQDLIDAAEETTGLSLQQFFDQWVFHGGTPQLTVTQSWDAQNKLAKVTVRQTHKTDGDVLLFHLPTKLRFITEEGVIDHPVTVSEASHDFYVPLPAKPTNVRFDPELTLLAKTTFNKPTAMLTQQLQNADDAVGRLIAVDALKNKKDAKTIAALQAALRQDAFWGVRVEAARALRSINSDEALAALIDSLDNNHPRARDQVVQSVAGYYHEDARDALIAHLQNEANPQIRANALRSLGKYGDNKIRKAITEALDSES